MKCPACGYRYIEPDKDSETFKYISDGNESFVDISFSDDGEVAAYIEGRGFYRVYFKACPKCNCVQIDKW